MCKPKTDKGWAIKYPNLFSKAYLRTDDKLSKSFIINYMIRIKSKQTDLEL